VKDGFEGSMKGSVLENWKYRESVYPTVEDPLKFSKINLTKLCKKWNLLLPKYIMERNIVLNNTAVISIKDENQFLNDPNEEVQCTKYSDKK